MIDLAARFQQADSVVSRVIAGEAILVPIRSSREGLDSIFTLNETAAFVWSLIDGQHTLAQIRDCLVEEYAVSPEDAERDLGELIEQLQEIQAIQAAG